MLVSCVALFLASQLTTPASPTPTPAPVDVEIVDDVRGRFLLEPVLQLSAQSAAARVDTTMTTSFGLRAGYIDNGDGGFFFGGDLAGLFGYDNAGTPQVAIDRRHLLLEARGLIGYRHMRGMVGLGGYGYGGVGVGQTSTETRVFDDARSHAALATTARLGAGVETTFGAGAVRLELGGGMRDVRFELVGSLSAGLRF